MTAMDLKDPREVVAEHVDALRDYAKRVIVRSGSLSVDEDGDRSSRLDEFFAVGSSFDLTECEMVVQLYRGVLSGQRRLGCDCPTCRHRAGRDG